MAFCRLKTRFWRRRHVIVSALAIAVVLLLVANALSSSHVTRPSLAPVQRSLEHFIPETRAVHLDLKGAPPKIAFFARLFPLLSSLGANALLLEWEDMFPWEGPLADSKALNAYSKADVTRVLALARDSGLQVIPLVQTFGHLEFALKLEPFAHLREVPHLPQALCPQRNASFPFITQMIDQMLALHPNVKYLHIGADEVYHLGMCDVCRHKDRDRLFLDHVTRVAKYVVERHHVIPIIWDDMLRQLSPEAIKESGIAELGVEPMIWTYVKDIYRFVPESQFALYSQLFPNIWTASAFKGAFGETLTAPNVKMHVDNNVAWLQVMHEQRRNFKQIRGIAVTGWQRYDHLATLCELLPAAIPSLALSLHALKTGALSPKEAFRSISARLNCQSNEEFFAEDAERALELMDARDPHLFTRFGDCEFAGSQVLRLVRRHEEVIRAVKAYLYDVTEHKAWLTMFNVAHNISSPFRVDEALQEFSSVNYQLEALVRSAREALDGVYDRSTTAEWIEQNVWPSVARMEELMRNAEDLKRARFWPKRPVRVTKGLEERLALLERT